MWRASAALSGTRTTLVFDGARVPLETVSIAASAGRFATPRLGATLAVAALVDGAVDGVDLGPGAGASLGASWLARLEDRRGAGPFVLVTATLAAVRAGDDYAAVDARAGVSVGKTFARRVTVYGAARAFGGPVWWQDATGSDRHHVTAGAGATFRIPGVVDLAVEAMPLGEQSATAAVTLHF